jgi:hypothetical protein
VEAVVSAQPYGSVGEEAARLFEALQQAAAGWTRGAAEASPSHDHADTPLACRACPVCQVVAAVHQVRPETVQHLADAAASLTAALSDLASGVARSTGGSAPRDSHGGRGDDVQRIDITD